MRLIKCDGCDELWTELNHWFVVKVNSGTQLNRGEESRDWKAGYVTITAFNPNKTNPLKTRVFCGQGCVSKEVSRVLGQIHGETKEGELVNVKDATDASTN